MYIPFVAHRSNSVLERVTREREDAMFREMINGMTISTPTTTTTTTLHTAAAAATDSIESLSTRSVLLVCMTVSEW